MVLRPELCKLTVKDVLHNTLGHSRKPQGTASLRVKDVLHSHLGHSMWS